MLFGNLDGKEAERLRAKIAVIDDRTEITYESLLNKIYAFAKRYDIYLSPQQTVIPCIFEDSIEAVICFFGLIHLGHVPCLISPNLSKSDLSFYLNQLNAKTLFIGNNTTHFYLTNHFNVQVFSSDNLKINAIHTSSLNIQKKDPLFCCFTSGTTDSPCAIIHSYHDIQQMCENYGNGVLGLAESDILFTTSKMFFAYGLNSLLFSLYLGATAILSPRNLTPETIYQKIEEKKPTVFFSTPRIYQDLIPFEATLQSCTIRHYVSAGERLPEPVYQAWQQKHQADIIDGIGCTETLSTFISNLPFKTKRGSSGKLVPGFEAEIRTANDKLVGINIQGDLWIKGNTYPEHYLNNVQATHTRFKNGWFATHDICSVDEESYFYHHGRKNDLIYRQGVWVSPQQIEKRILSHPHILEAILVGYKEIRAKMYLVCFLSLSECASINNQLIEELHAINRKSNDFFEKENIDYFIVVNEIPKTLTGKIQRHQFQKNPYITQFLNILNSDCYGKIL